VPPLDVAFVWHIHRLQAAAYAADTAAIAGGMPLHPPAQQVGGGAATQTMHFMQCVPAG
jgi:hypothetical protein